MPIYFQKDDHEYNCDSIETLLEESVENAIQDHFHETGNPGKIDYSIKIDDGAPHKVKAELNLSHSDGKDRAKIDFSSYKEDILKLEYLGSDMSETSKIVLDYFENNLDSMIEMERVEADRFFTTQYIEWRG